MANSIRAAVTSTTAQPARSVRGGAGCAPTWARLAWGSCCVARVSARGIPTCDCATSLSEPLGLLARLERRLVEIIVVDATEWRSGQPDVLRHVSRQAHQHLGVQLRLGLLDGSTGGPVPDVAVGSIVYPPSGGEPGFEGRLLYLRAVSSSASDPCFFEDDILGHRHALEAFAEPQGKAVGHNMPVMKAHGAST